MSEYFSSRRNTINLVSALTLTLSFTLVTTAHAASQTLKYTYDSLGRVTFVDDSANGSRDFDFDAAGNRTQVVIGNSSDDDSDGGTGSGPVALIAPTGLSIGGPYSMYGGYDCAWAAVPGATQYKVGLADGSVITTTQTNADSSGPRPNWVMAINDSGQGPKASF